MGRVIYGQEICNNKVYDKHLTKGTILSFLVENFVSFYQLFQNKTTYNSFHLKVTFNGFLCSDPEMSWCFCKKM